MHGFYVWFDEEVADGLVCSNAPTLKEAVYGRAFFPLEQVVEIAAGDRISLRFSATLVAGNYVMRWDTKILDRDGVVRADFRQSSFRARPLIKSDIAVCAPGFIPELSESGMAELGMLQAMTEGATLEQIAANSATAYPRTFASAAVALQHVKAIGQKYSKPVAG